VTTTAANGYLVTRYLELAREYHEFEARYFGVSAVHEGPPPAGHQFDEEALHTLTSMRAEVDAARDAWIESLLRP
jgi:hypothetical protein